MSKKKLLIITIMVFSSFVSTYYCSADDLTLRENISRVLKADFDGDGAEDTAILKQRALKLEDKNDSFDLEVKSKGKIFVVKNILTDNDSVNYTYSGLEKIIVSSKYKPFIGVSYGCGTHSWGLRLYSFDGSHIKKAGEFGSDGPYVNIEDIDNNGQNEIVCVFRTTLTTNSARL